MDIPYSLIERDDRGTLVYSVKNNRTGKLQRLGYGQSSGKPKYTTTNKDKAVRILDEFLKTTIRAANWHKVQRDGKNFGSLRELKNHPYFVKSS